EITNICTNLQAFRTGIYSAEYLRSRVRFKQNRAAFCAIYTHYLCL
ncbi:MAG: hypothetical protein AVDCRST_MAG95-2602, partial [uncultured Adhaeribacter sp.]